ncbi:hypothetical protein DP117_35790 [Brasilonema sp. UFV-L1]|nr:hypothetical protein [Brasilonema sp. UFV-L1]
MNMITYTTDELLSFTKKHLAEVARELKIQGRTKMSHHDLIDKIVEATTPETIEATTLETVEATTPETIEATTPETVEVVAKIEIGTLTETPTPEQFFNQVIALNEVLAVHQACNALLDRLDEKYSVATISKKLTAYKKLFYKYLHVNSELNETVETKNGTNTQHIAARLLTLSDEQKEVLGVDRNQRDNARAGFDESGDLRDVEKPPIDITSVVKKSLECLQSIDPHTIGVGIINLTGLRANEQNMPAREYPDWGLIERDMIVVDEFVIGFKGISKKSSSDDANAYHARATLAPAQMIVDAQKRFKSSKAVQSIPTNYESYRSGFLGTFAKRFEELFGKELSTIEAYDDDGHLTDANGTPHKARAFYACALRAILKAKNFKDSAASKYIQLCLAHESQGITIKYLGRYDESEFINPIEINIPTNIKELGKMKTVTKESTTTPTASTVSTASTKAKKASKDSFDIDAFIDGLDGDLQVKFQEGLNSGLSLTNAVLAVINAAKQKASLEVRTTKRTPVTDEVAEIVEAIMTYNIRQELNTNCVVPTYTLINKISERLLNKTIAKVTVDNWINANADRLDKQLVNFEIPGGLYNSGWNGKHHRKTMDVVIESVITIFNER